MHSSPAGRKGKKKGQFRIIGQQPFSVWKAKDSGKGYSQPRGVSWRNDASGSSSNISPKTGANLDLPPPPPPQARGGEVPAKASVPIQSPSPRGFILPQTPVILPVQRSPYPKDPPPREPFVSVTIPPPPPSRELEAFERGLSDADSSQPKRAQLTAAKRQPQNVEKSPQVGPRWRPSGPKWSPKCRPNLPK